MCGFPFIALEKEDSVIPPCSVLLKKNPKTEEFF